MYCARSKKRWSGSAAEFGENKAGSPRPLSTLVSEHRDGLEDLGAGGGNRHLLRDLAQYGYLGRRIPHEMIALAETARSHQQGLAQKRGFAESLTLEQLPGVAEISDGLIEIGLRDSHSEKAAEPHHCW
jgi:hypothetical protein